MVRAVRAAGSHFRQIPAAIGEQQLIDPASGVAQLGWPTDVESTEALRGFDLLLLTATEPTPTKSTDYPSAQEVADAWCLPHDREGGAGRRSRTSSETGYRCPVPLPAPYWEVPVVDRLPENSATFVDAPVELADRRNRRRCHPYGSRWQSRTVALPDACSSAAPSSTTKRGCLSTRAPHGPFPLPKRVRRATPGNSEAP